jgi:hypothetical protein
MHSIAAYAHHMGVKALFDSKESVCYSSGVSAKKALIGCESPMARGAEPHPARFAAFLFRPRLGGPNGEAQASPATLRVPRSLTPVRAAAQCESWSAVVHQAQLETIMAQIIQHPTAKAERVVQTRIAGRLPKSILSLPTIIRERRYAAYLKRSRQEEIAKTIASANEWASVANALRYKAAVLQEKAKGEKV